MFVCVCVGMTGVQQRERESDEKEPFLSVVHDRYARVGGEKE